MEWLTRPEDVRKAHARFIVQLTEASMPSTATEENTEGVADNPFPGVMRGSALGVVGKT